MITLDSPDVFGSCIFCDDIRIENTGKLIYIGAYTGHMYVPNSFPVVIQKLAVAVNYSQLPSKFISPKFWVFLPGDAEDKPSIEALMPEEAGQHALSQVMNSQLPVQREAIYANLNSTFTFFNLVIKEPGLIRVRAVRDQELVRLGTLFVRTTDDPQQSVNPTAQP
jgi:hypothetical protein